MKFQLFRASLFFILSLLYFNAVAAEKTITLYGLFETAISSEKKYNNPFDYSEVSFNALFTSPEKITFKISSFYDGKNEQGSGTWKIRFMPDQPGTWRYTIKNKTGETVQNGQFIVTEKPAHTGNHGHVKVDTKHPRYLIHDDGSAHYWIGGKWISAKDYGPESKAGEINKGFDRRVNVAHGHKTDQQLLDYLDLLAKYKHNGILLKIAQYPLENDRLSWDLKWIQRGEWLVEEALKRGIYVQVNIFDTWSRDRNKYFENKMPGKEQLFDVWHDGDDKYKQNYLRYIISRFSAYANVYWELGNEMDHSPNCAPCFIKLANEKYLPWIRQYDPYQLPIGLSEKMWRATSADIGFLHQTNELPDESMKRPVIMNELVRYDLHQSFLQKAWRKLFGKKLHTGLWHDDAINNEDLRFTYRRTFWNVFTRGGSGSSEATWLDIYKPPSTAVLSVMRDHMHLSTLIDELRPILNEMYPLQNFINSGNANEKISTRGSRPFYVTYFDAGYKKKMKIETIKINPLPEDYHVAWMDPSTGKILAEYKLARGSEQLERPEYLQDIVLLLKR